MFKESHRSSQRSKGQVKGQNVKGQNVKGQNVKGQSVKGQVKGPKVKSKVKRLKSQRSNQRSKGQVKGQIKGVKPLECKFFSFSHGMYKSRNQRIFIFQFM